MQATEIQWTEKTWNPVRGCTRVSEGCTRCYAERQAARYSGPGLPFEGFAVNTPAGPRWTGKVELIPEKLGEPLRMRKPAMIFTNSMSDLFHEGLSNEDIAAVFGVMAACPQHTFQVLTKRPARMLEWFGWLERAAAVAKRDLFQSDGLDWTRQHVMRAATLRTGMAFPRGRSHIGMDAPWPLPNVWLGVSCEDQATADERIPLLLQCPAAVRWVSAEPLLGPIDFEHLAPWDDFHTNALDTPERSRSLDWVVGGGESGPGARPCHPKWARSIRDQCQAAGVAFFWKQWGEHAPFDALAPDLQHQLRAPSILTDTEFVPATLYRVGKRAAGRLLDGRTWDEMPRNHLVEV